MASESWKSRIDWDNSVEVCCMQAKLYSISEHQIDIAKQVKRAGDRKRKIEAHGGARRRTFKDIKAAKYDRSDREQE